MKHIHGNEVIAELQKRHKSKSPPRRQLGELLRCRYKQKLLERKCSIYRSFPSTNYVLFLHSHFLFMSFSPLLQVSDMWRMYFTHLQIILALADVKEHYPLFFPQHQYCQYACFFLTLPLLVISCFTYHKQVFFFASSSKASFSLFPFTLFSQTFSTLRGVG